MRNTFLRLGQVLTVPLRGPCTHCPIPPAVILPPRRLPPEVSAPALASAAPVSTDVDVDAAPKKSESPCTPASTATATVPAAGTAGLSTAR
jgi:hypothetical protein